MLIKKQTKNLLLLLLLEQSELGLCSDPLWGQFLRSREALPSGSGARNSPGNEEAESVAVLQD